MRATTMYFGAALHTPRGGQCPSLLRPKEGAEGREGRRESRRRGACSTVGIEERDGRAEERGAGGDGGHTSAEWKKNEQTSSKGDEERDRARSAPVRTLPPPVPPLFSTLLSSFFFLLSLSLIVTLSQLSLGFALRCTAGCTAAGFLLPERFP